MAALLIACSQEVILLEGESVQRVHEGYGIYYGITWDQEWVYIASRGWPDGQSILVFDKELVSVGTLPVGKLLDIHQIGWFNGRLYITNTKANCLRVWDGEQPWIWDYSGAGGDVDHINSVWADGAFVYIGEHRWNKPSRVQIFDKDFNLVCIVEGMGRKLHNVYREGTKLYTCSSGEDALLALDLTTGERQAVDLRSHHEGYARGLARTEGRWYIGMSAWAKRGERHMPGPSAVLVLDNNFALAERVDLATGQIYELRALEGDRAHNGLPFPGRC